MKKTITLFFFLLLYITSSAQQFIKTFGDANYGVIVRILPTNDNGWVVFTMDSLKMTKFDNCGIPQWSNHYLVPSTHQGLYDLIKTSDGGFALLTRMQLASTYAALVTKINAAGDIIWSKSYEDPTNDYSQFPYTISEDLQGRLIIFCGTQFHIANNPAYNMILKITSNGTLVSNTFYDWGGIWGGAIVTSDNGVLIRTGNTLIKTTSSGNIQWATGFSGTYNFFAPIEVSDGYILTGYTNLGNQISFHKYDKQGNQLWAGFKQSNYAGSPPKMIKKSNGNICGVFPRAIVEFDKDLNIVEHTSIQSTLNLTERTLCYLPNGTAVVTGLRSTASDLFFAKLNPGYTTSCDAPPIQMTLTAVSNNIFATTITGSPYLLNEVSRVFSVDTFTVSTELACRKSLELGNDTLVCSPAPVTLQNLFVEQFETYLWSTGAKTPSIAVNKTGTYWLHVTYNCGEDSLADTIRVTFETPINTDLGMDILECENQTHVFYATPCDSCSYLWSTGSIGDTIIVLDPGNYWLQITDSNGCIYSDTVNYATSKCECQLYLPNSFTPNNDGKNEVFQPKYYCDLADYRLQIYNRWGQPVFSSDNANESWDGRHQNNAVPSGVYFYVVSYTPILKGRVNKTLSKTGSVTVFY